MTDDIYTGRLLPEWLQVRPSLHNVSTSNVERKNLTTACTCPGHLVDERVLKVENRLCGCAPHHVYNFVRIDKTLRVTPAVAAAVLKKLWEIGDIARLVEHSEGPASSYKKKVAIGIFI